jgi:hypothetical protein
MELVQNRVLVRSSLFALLKNRDEHYGAQSVFVSAVVKEICVMVCPLVYSHYFV